MNEKELVRQAKAGDKSAFCTLYGLYKDRLYRYAFYRLGNKDDALDAVSDTIVCAFEEIKELRKPDAFSAWLFKIHRITCSDCVKQQIKQRETANIEDYRNSTDLSHGFESAASELNEALGILTEDEKEIVLLSVIAGFTSKEIAKINGMTAGGVRSKLSRSLTKMRSFLE